MNTRARPRLLLVPYYFPPLGMGGVQRPLKFARYLPEFGWDVTVVTAAPDFSMAADPSLCDQLPDSVSVERVKTWDPSRRFRSHRGPNDGSWSSVVPPPRWAKTVQQFMRWPDDKFGFARAVLRTVRRMEQHQSFDAVWTSSPPPSVHRVGLQLQRHRRMAWIADFRDPWMLRRDDWGPTPWHARYAKRLCGRIVARADRVVAVNDSIAAALAPFGPARPVAVIHNGYDEADFKSVASPRDDSNLFTVLFYGTLAPIVDPEPAFRMLSQWRQRSHPAGLRIVHVGMAMGVDTMAIARRCGLEDIYEAVGYRPHAEALTALLSADLVIVPMTGRPGYESTVPGRLFEVMRSLRPILFVGPPGNEAARILQTVDGAWCVAPGNLDGGPAALDAIAALPRGRMVRRVESITRYERREQTRRLAAMLDEVRAEREKA